MLACPLCGGDSDECCRWSDAEMGWVCEVKGEAVPDGAFHDTAFLAADDDADDDD